MRETFSCARSALMIGALVILQGCTLLPSQVSRPASEAPTQATQSSDGEQLLTYVLRARLMTAGELTAEKDRARAELALDNSNRNRVKLAILLAFTLPGAAGPSAQEDAELQSLIEPMAFSPSVSLSSSEPGVRAIATLLQSLAQDRRRVRELLARNQASRRDEANAQAEARILRMQLEELERKLNALKSIERSVTSRSAEGNTK